MTIINGISESLSFMSNQGDLLVESQVLTGQAPNQILRYGDRVYIVNSLSNSVTVYDCITFELLDEFSTGTGTNPYKAVIVDDKIYLTAYLSHQLLVFDLEGQPEGTTGFATLNEDAKTYYPFPQGIVHWNGWILAACMYSEENGATKTRDPGRVAVYSIAQEAVTGYIEASAKDTNSLYLAGDTLYIISSGNYNSGFDESGRIESVELSGVDLASPAGIVPVVQAEDNSFGAFCIHGTTAWTGNLGNGTLRAFQTATTPWTESLSLSFSGDYGMAYIPDIQYAMAAAELYVTEFNGNKLYILDPVDLSVQGTFDCSANNYGDAQFMLLVE